MAQVENQAELCVSQVASLNGLALPAHKVGCSSRSTVGYGHELTTSVAIRYESSTLVEIWQIYITSLEEEVNPLSMKVKEDDKEK